MFDELNSYITIHDTIIIIGHRPNLFTLSSTLKGSIVRVILQRLLLGKIQTYLQTYSI